MSRVYLRQSWIEESETLTKKYRKLETCMGCPSHIFFTTDTDDRNWTVTKFIEKHNYPLATENEQHLLRSHHNISKMQGSLIKNMTEAGVKQFMLTTFYLTKSVGSRMLVSLNLMPTTLCIGKRRH
ncbi:hypothetical protein KSP40_PGU017340 [Platanthera guangdongensis]|uniref:FAR1 domain-containing protein n=1 Tax=Platanthera guangdongensis TaxID=2320717 RepID=A0ABR2N5I0_9ASPA